MKKVAWLYGLAMVANVGLAELGVQLGAGNVPVPENARWVVPIAVAMITAATATLPKLNAKRRARTRSARLEWGVSREGDGSSRGNASGAG